jgi:hypothetical protein
VAAPASATPPAAEPTDTKAAPESKPAAQAQETPREPEVPKTEPAAQKPATPPPRPNEILLAEGVAFEIDDEKSALRLILKDKCEDKVGYEQPALDQCVASERKKFPADVLRFRKLGGQLRWTVYKRSGERLQVVFSAPFTFTEETDYSVSLLVQGGSGFQPLVSQSRSVPLNFPTTSSIEVDDPLWGLLLYRAKTGLVE